MQVQKHAVRLLLEPLVIAIALALLVRMFVHVYAIPSASMEPTLAAGDHILVTSLGGRPQRGEVVVFRSPRTDDLLVKRVIALPGDLVATADGNVTIGGHPLRESYVRDAQRNGTIAPQIVPPDCYFVMGDNRGQSADSRSFGAVDRTQVVGRARLILWSSRESPGSHGLAALRLFRTIE